MGDRVLTFPPREERLLPLTRIEARKADGETPATIAGYGAVFNTSSLPFWGGWREKIDPAAFTRTLKTSIDVVSFFNHNPDHVLGRRGNGTLTLAADERGLAFEVQPPDTGWARDLLTSIDRGDVHDASFAFRAVRDRWDTDDDGVQMRTLLEVELYEVGPVTMGQYPDASSGLRSLGAALRTAPPEVMLHAFRSLQTVQAETWRRLLTLRAMPDLMGMDPANMKLMMAGMDATIGQMMDMMSVMMSMMHPPEESPPEGEGAGADEMNARAMQKHDPEHVKATMGSTSKMMRITADQIDGMAATVGKKPQRGAEPPGDPSQGRHSPAPLRRQRDLELARLRV